jgi:hypothetical protein
MSFERIPKPNFFVVGAPKCGTTALSEYLAAHPNVYFSSPKEPEYFNTDHAEDFRFACSEEVYASCFRGANERHAVVGEGSVWYFHSEVAVSRILAFRPDARFIVMVRNPVDMVYSLHSELIFTNDEDVEDFETAWRLQNDRKSGRKLPGRCREPKAIRYGDVGKLGRDLERLYSSVPRDRVAVVIFDDFKRNTDAVYRQILGFLEVPVIPLPDYPVVNASKRVTSRAFRGVLHFSTRVKRTLGYHKSLGIGRRLALLNATSTARPPLSPELRRELCNYFRDDVELLSSLTKRDLKHWVTA